MSLPKWRSIGKDNRIIKREIAVSSLIDDATPSVWQTRKWPNLVCPTQSSSFSLFSQNYELIKKIIKERHSFVIIRLSSCTGSFSSKSTLMCLGNLSHAWPRGHSDLRSGHVMAPQQLANKLRSLETTVTYLFRQSG